MKTNKEILVVRTLTMAVQGALVAMFALPLTALAADDDVATLTKPTNSVEIGLENTSRDSAKFGEYNGLNKSGVDVIGNFSVRGGDAYNAFEGGDGVNRWEIKGTDLGTTSRELGGSVSNQGRWNLGIGYDELRHNISDTFQTPLQGSMGGNSFTLPANFGVTNTSFIDPNGKGGAQALTATQQAAFQTQDVHSDRKNTSFTAGYNFSQQWGVKFDYNRLEQTGAKLMSVATDAAAAASGPNGSTWGVEKILMVMNPTNYTTDTFNLDLNWKGENGFLTAGYYGSFFNDNFNGLTFPNPYASKSATVPAMGTLGDFPINTISTAPSNDFHQLNLSGGYKFSADTKLAGGFSRGRNTQNENYPFAMLQVTRGVDGALASPMGGGVPPVGSLDGLVVTTHADLKLSNQTTKDLALSAGLKYNERDNQTASNTYNFIDLGGKNRTAVNAPMSNKKTQAEVAGDYRINQSNRVHLGYEYEKVERWCNNAAANSAQSPSATVPAGYYAQNAGTCVQIPESKENKLVAGYKLKVGETVNFNAGYAYAKRDADVNNAFYNPIQADAEGFENLGYRAFFDASRTENLVKAGVNWQANDKLSLGLNARYLDDQYNDSPLGVQGGRTWSANLDASYSYTDNGIVSAYWSVQNRQRDLLTGNGRFVVTAPTNLWSNQLYDDDNTVGLSIKQKGLMGGKLELVGDLNYSLGKTHYSTQVPYASATCGLTTSLTCGDTPDIKNETVMLRIGGTYQIDKASKVALGYLHQKLTSNDYYYNFYQTGYTGTGNLPTNEQAPSYSVNLVSASYIYMFK